MREVACSCLSFSSSQESRSSCINPSRRVLQRC